MREAHDQRAGLGEAIQYPGGDQWVRSSFGFPRHEDAQHDHARHKDAQNLGRGPRKNDTTEIETQQRQDRHAHDCCASKPVHLAALPDCRGLWIDGVEEHVQDDKGGKAAWQVDQEDPAPIQILRENAPEKWADASGGGPDKAGRC